MIAVVGAGFSGLALTYQLLKRGKKVVLFEKEKIGGGASGIASGLLHPYPGEQGKIAWRGLEAMKEARALVKLAGDAVYQERGILKVAVTLKQQEVAEALSKKYQDVTWWDIEQCQRSTCSEIDFPGLFIHSGITVHSLVYLEALWKICQNLGAVYIKKKVFYEELKGFKAVVLAVGGGIKEFPIVKKLNLRFNKGQLLVCQKSDALNIKRSFIGKGYLALSKKDNECFLGSTYEREVQTDQPCIQVASPLILNQISRFFPMCLELKIKKCLAGVRVVGPLFPRPFFQKLTDQLYVITGMGSRGLLYHALCAKEIAEEITSS